MSEPIHEQQAQAEVAVLIEHVDRMLSLKVLEGRAEAPDWESRPCRSVTAMAIFRSDVEAPKAIAQAYGSLIQEAHGLGPIVKARRPIFSGCDHGFTIELGVDAVSPAEHIRFSSPVVNIQHFGKRHDAT